MLNGRSGGWNGFENKGDSADGKELGGDNVGNNNSASGW